MTSARLLDGARVLGRLWRDGFRCDGGWSTACACASPGRFCATKAKWLVLAEREVGDGPFGIIEGMTGPEFDAAGLTITIRSPDFGDLKVGHKGVALADVARLAGNDVSGARDVLRVLSAFPGSKLQKEGER
jgi:hypothetical protein